ncbi:MAG: vitamin B12 dependent-methionine synthase activation domain-containing protein [Candidatus Zixiibacteriota bacterium]
MRQVINFEIEDLIPPAENVLKSQGIPPGTEVPEKILDLVEQSLEIFSDLCEPAGIIGDVSTAQFRTIYNGAGKNESMTPVAKIFPVADHLALFAITVGATVSNEIRDLFEANEFALASMLDTAASEATELAGHAAEQAYLEQLIESGQISRESYIMRYSPGYCGWHISGQQKLFDYLNPEEIGIHLSSSYMMEPIKSISGVMLVGPARIHMFDIAYSFCDQCLDRGCRARINGIRKQ